VPDGRGMLFARNLYPNEIADALIKAMNDDAFVDEAAHSNLSLMRNIASRELISSKVVNFYHSITMKNNTNEE
jgi:uncharacterized protein (DUF2336 family)